MPFQQKLTGSIEPTDLAWKKATLTDRKAFYEKAGDVALERLKIQLGRGIGANGRLMKPRLRAVLPDGSDGPVMEPRYDASRVISLSDYMATPRSLTVFWQGGTGHQTHRRARKLRQQKKKGGKKPPPFGQILAWHADGEVPHAPVRDVRLSRSSIQQIKLTMRKWWEARQRSQARKAKPTPAAVPTPPPARRRSRAIPPRPAARPVPNP
jgi:hypothetical protein